MMKAFFFFLSLAFGFVIQAQDRIQNTGSNLSSLEAESVLAHHNQVRKNVGSKPLTWSIKLAKYAQEWADHLATANNCKMLHRVDPGKENGTIYGENIFWGSPAKSFTPLDASEEWYSEIKIYKYNKITEHNWHPTSHYTQMVWKDTKEIGVGMAVCPDGNLIIVANYFPAGNYLNQFPY